MLFNIYISFKGEEETVMRILVLGNINSKWVKEYIENVLIPLGHNVDVL